MINKENINLRTIFESSKWRIVSFTRNKFGLVEYEAVHEDGFAVKDYCSLIWFKTLNRKYQKVDDKTLDYN